MSARKLSRTHAEAVAGRLKVFAQPQRLMILTLLLSGERTVGEIDEATGIGQPLLSQQLAELRRAELVKTRRAAKQVHYRLADEDTVLLVRSLEALFGGKADPAKALAQAVLTPNVRKLEKRAPSGAAGFATIVGRADTEFSG